MARIFVYGSLRKGMYNHEIYLKNKSTYIEDAYVKGTLYSLKGKKYPALIAGNDTIIGEIFEVDAEAMGPLNALENYVEGCVDNEYNKVNLQIYNEKGEATERLDVYVYNDANPEKKACLEHIIEGNDFCQYYRERYV